MNRTLYLHRAQLTPTGGAHYAKIAFFHFSQEIVMIKGLRTVVYPVTDLAEGKAWYADIFGTEPHFDQPFYVGFAVGGFELGLVPDGLPGAGGGKAYWGVDNIEADVARVVAAGGSLIGDIQDVGQGIRVADLADPFGNVLGLIENPVFDVTAVR
jgi:predicted enzyme related to lactoylglutathione lyase